MKTFAFLLYILVILRGVVAEKEEKDETSCDRPLLQNKCEKRNCIARTENTSVDWNEVTPRSFVVRWSPAPGAKCYHIQLLSAYTVRVLRTINCHPGYTYEFEGLKPSMIYGVQVSTVNHNCRRGRPGIPARTRTLWAPTTKPTTVPVPKTTPEPGNCGRNFFTCHSDSSECVRMKKWCDRILDCVDGSDERGCPGGCEEIDIDFLGGNYSCSRWGSPGSVCLFDCSDAYVRDGARYTFCSRRLKRWMNTIPTCRLRSTDMLEVVTEETTATSLTVEWEPVEEAVRYTVVAIEQGRKKDAALTKTVSVDSNECCRATVSPIPPETEFQITLVAIDYNDVDGIQSDPIFARTASKAGAIIDENEAVEE